MQPQTQSVPMTATHPDRVLLGLVLLLGERLNADLERLALVVGMVQQTAERTGRTARLIWEPGTRIAGRMARWASHIPGADLVRQRVDGTQDRLARLSAAARQRGTRTMAASRAEAIEFLKVSTDDSLDWAQRELVPRLVDGTLPEIRARVLPAVIDDLAADPRVRSLIVEQSRGAIGDAAEHLRTNAASMDNRVESALRRLFGVSRQPGSASA